MNCRFLSLGKVETIMDLIVYLSHYGVYNDLNYISLEI